MSTLALAAINATARPTPIPGRPRVLTVTNTGTADAIGVAVDPSVVLPTGTAVTHNCGAMLAPLASCTFTITPGTVATAAPVALSIAGSNSNAVTASVQVLAYGSVYQGGLVFAVDDATPDTGSVGGKVVESMPSTWNVMWSPRSALSIPGIDQTSTTPCASNRDGACNTAVIVAHHAEGPMTYAAGVCSASTFAGYSDWYLPAICEAGVAGGASLPSGCGTPNAPTIQNIYSSLVDNATVGASFESQWTSTTILNDTFPFVQHFAHPTHGSFQTGFQYNLPDLPVRCVRAISF